MGLFSNKKKPCPICGGATPRLLSTKVEGQPLCSSCASKAQEMQGGSSTASGMTLDAFREYMAFYEENGALRSAFQGTYQYNFGFLSGDICLDVPQRLLRFSVADDAIVFEASNIRSFRILEDTSPLFEGTQDALLCYESSIPERVLNMGPEITRFEIEQRQYEQMKRMDEVLKEKAKDAGESYSPSYYSSPDVDTLKPFQNFWLQIELDHPYWSKREYSQGAPGFLSSNPSIKAYLRDYEEKAAQLRQLADQLMAVLNPEAPERHVNAQAAAGTRAAPDGSAAAADVVEEIQRYKSLLDSGAITQEEFSAKKRQLLGI